MELNIAAPINLATHSFCVAKPAVLLKEDVPKFKDSLAFMEITQFLCRLQKSVQGKSCIDIPSSPKLKPIEQLLDKVASYSDSIPPIPQYGHFANRAFRSLIKQIESNSASLMQELLAAEPYLKAAIELGSYFVSSFGSYERLEYGTAHELNFLMFLYLVFRIGYYGKEEFDAVVGVVFAKYVRVVQKFIAAYNLDPAISNNAWGLDTFYFLPFVFGASQLVNNETVTPKSISSDETTEEGKYTYLDCTRFIKRANKNTSFTEAAPTLTLISNVSTWSKIAQGFPKMYADEVLGKHTVVKHLLFGSVLKFVAK